MATLPSASTRLSDESGSAPVSTDLCAVFAPCAKNADGVPRLYANLEALLGAHGYSEGAEYAALHMDEADKPVLFVPMPIATAGAVVRTESVHTGTSKVAIAAGPDGILAEVDLVLQAASSGTIGTDQILLSLSLDGGTTFKTVRLGTATSYTIPHIGLVVSFGIGTVVDGDTLLKAKTKAPMFDADGVALGRAKMVAQQRGVRSWLFVGDVSTLALGQAIETAANAYESADRFIVARFQARDRRVLESSRDRVAMVGAPELTFAEVGPTGDTITRDVGSWVTDGFQVGDWVTITGTASNNVSGKVTTVTATVLTLDTTDLEAETIEDAGVRVTAEPSFTFSGSAKTITRNRGSWLAEGFQVGDTVTIEGTASNDGEHVITTLTATVMTCSASTFTDEVIGSCTASVTFEETNAEWVAAIDSEFAGISSAPRVNIAAGRGKKLSPITGYTMRRPWQWADTVRSYQRDLKSATWEKSFGPMPGWSIEGEHDERVDGGLLAARFTCARTWGNGPLGAFTAMSLTRASDDSILSLDHNMAVANLAQTVCQRATEDFVGATIVLNPADAAGKRTATKSSLADLKAKVDSELQRNLLSNVGGEGQRASSVEWIPATDDDLGVADATLHGTCRLNLNGTLVHISTKVAVK